MRALTMDIQGWKWLIICKHFMKGSLSGLKLSSFLFFIYSNQSRIWPFLNLPVLWIRIGFNADPDPGVLTTQNVYSWEKFIFLIKTYKIICLYASIKDAQAKGEFFIPQTIISTWSTTSKLEISGFLLVIFRWFLFSWIRIQIQPRPKWMRIHADSYPDPQHRNLHSFTTDPEQLRSPPTYLQNPSSGIRSRYL